jgi:phosphatidylglycerol:prolipoprotein diacylglycerol transferase
MIDPVIFSIKVLGFTLTLRWYGLLVILGAVVGTWVAEKEIKRRGGNGETVWDALVWVLIPGIVGARLWYVLNSILGGNRTYLEDPASVFKVWEGGLHFFGGLLFGAIALLFYIRQNRLDPWLFLDAVAPATLIGQAVARPANFINQELYGPPTRLPWGIPIDAGHRIASYSDLGVYPVESTRFHPTFAYEMILNFIIALFLIWYSRQYKERMKPGAVFGAWLLFAGLARAFIEIFRPDQPRIPGTDVSYTAAVSLLMAVAGAVFLLVRYGKLHFAFAEGWEEEYRISQPEKKTRTRQAAKPVAVEEVEEEPVPPKRRAVKKPASRKSAAASKPKSSRK